MADTSIHSIKATDGAALRYITNGDKTVNGLYVQSYACRADSRGAAADFRAVRERGTGRTEILAHHIIQSFAPNEVTPEQALQIGEELCDRFLQGNYQYVLAVHNDRDHLHCHIIFNNTNLYNGLSFTYEHNQGKVKDRSWAQLREISDEICKEHGISVIESKGKGVSHFERDMQIQGKSWKDKLRAKIAEVAFYSKSFEDFLQRCTECGIEYVYKPQNKVKLKFRLSGEGQQKFTRADTLGDEYTAEKLAESIQQIQKAQAIMEKLSEKKNPKKPAPVTVTKTEPTAAPPVTAPTNQTPPTPTAPKTDYVYKPPTEEELDRIFGVSVTTTNKPVTIKPAEVKAPEKKEDVWAAIRGMGDAEKIIADLEAGDIKSLSELRGFFWNIKHKDDHTAELADLKKKYTAIDKLLEMMKQRTDNSATYKEYQDRSVLTQKHFRKKNAAAIDKYEEADRYINEHIKAYYIDGKAPKRSELQAMSLELKEKYNALVSEHNAFLRKQAAASQYTRQVRRYLEAKEQQERNRQYQERKRSQQKKKDYLE